MNTYQSVVLGLLVTILCYIWYLLIELGNIKDEIEKLKQKVDNP